MQLAPGALHQRLLNVRNSFDNMRPECQHAYLHTAWFVAVKEDNPKLFTERKLIFWSRGFGREADFSKL